MSKALSNLYWHDGNLIDISYGIDKNGKSSVQMTALFYKDEQAPSRDMYQIKCEGVLQFNSSLNTTELKSNMFAGNISSGYLKGKTLWVYFTDGLLEVHATRFRLTKC
jgi:hypothetical protein